MAGCYGNDSFDRYWESQLDKYLDEYDDDEDQDDENEDEDYEQLNDN
jgi:hypothetical protein